MKIIGLTGGIGSGKSTVSQYLIQQDFDIIDADKIAREIVAPGSETLRKITQLFGIEVLYEDGSLNRKKLGSIVFSDQEKKMKLDHLMHEKVIEIINDRLHELKKTETKIAFIDAPLLFETGLDRYVSESWVVDIDDETRIARIIKRDSLSREEIMKRIKSQMSREEKIKKADKIINNSGTIQELYVQIDTLLKEIMEQE